MLVSKEQRGKVVILGVPWHNYPESPSSFTAKWTNDLWMTYHDDVSVRGKSKHIKDLYVGI